LRKARKPMVESIMIKKEQKIAFVSDSHLRVSQYGYAYRGGDFLNALIDALNSAAALGIEIVLHGGDLIDQKQPPSDVIEQLLKIEAVLLKNNQRMYVISGNHEKAGVAWSVVLARAMKLYNPDIVPRMQCIDNTTIVLDSGLSIFGLASCSVEELKTHLQVTDLKADVLLWHGMVKEFCGFDAGGSVSITDFYNGPFDNVLLGDIHVHQFYDIPGRGVIGYPGSTELCASNEDPNKKFAILTFSPDAPVRVQSVPIKTRTAVSLLIQTEEELQAAIGLLTDYTNKEDMILVFVKAHAQLENVYARLHAACKGKATLRVTMHTDSVISNSTVEVTQELPPLESFLSQCISGGFPQLNKVAVSLINNKGNVKDTLIAYVEQRKLELTC